MAPETVPIASSRGDDSGPDGRLAAAVAWFKLCAGVVLAIAILAWSWPQATFESMAMMLGLLAAGMQVGGGAAVLTALRNRRRIGSAHRGA